MVIDDDNNPTKCAVARVLGYIEDGETKAQYYGTTDANPDKAIHKPAWHTPDNKIMLAWNQNDIKRYKPKPWFVTLRPDMIIGNLSFNSKGSLTEQSLTLIKSKGLFPRITQQGAA